MQSFNDSMSKAMAHWPRDSRGRMVPHTGFPSGLGAWMARNEREAGAKALKRQVRRIRQRIEAVIAEPTGYARQAERLLTVARVANHG